MAVQLPAGDEPALYPGGLADVPRRVRCRSGGGARGRGSSEGVVRLEEQAALFAVQVGGVRHKLGKLPSWWRDDLPGGLRAPVSAVVVVGLLRQGLAGVTKHASGRDEFGPTKCGTEAARALVRALGEERQRLLRAMGAGRQVVFYDLRPMGPSGWAHPDTGGRQWQSLGVDDATHPVRRLAALGLVVVAGGRALLTGAGRWAAEQLGESGDV